MTLSVGDSFPKNVKFGWVPWKPEESHVVACGIPTVYDIDKKLSGKKFVLVSVPAAFSPTCTADHIPPYKNHLNDLKKKGVDEVVVISANDPWVLAAWGKALGFKDEVIFASDANAEFSKSVGLSVDLTSKGMGVRNQRYAIVVDNGKITYIGVESGPGVTVSGVDAVLKSL